MEDLFIRIANSLEAIQKSLEEIADDSKASRTLREENQELFSELERKIDNLAKDPFGLNEGN